MITSLQVHHRYGDKRCVPCGVNKERFETRGCSSADCPWKRVGQEIEDVIARNRLAIDMWRLTNG